MNMKYPLLGYGAGGVRVAEIESSPGPQPQCTLNLPATNAVIPLSRILLPAPGRPEQYLIFDFLPTADGQSSSTNSLTVKLTPSTRKVETVKFRGQLRGYLAVQSPLWVEGKLHATRDQLVWELLAIHQPQWTAQFDINTDLRGQRRTLSASLPAPLYKTLGLDPSQGLLGQFEFALGAQPASHVESLENLDEQLAVPQKPDSAPIVVRMRQEVPLSFAQNQGLLAGQMSLSLPREMIRRADLDGDRPLWLVQTHAALDQDGSINPHQNAWIVRVQGVPTVAALEAYNRAAVRYLSSLQTVLDGRPVSGIPQFDARSWDPSTTWNDPNNQQPSDVEYRRRWTFTFDVSDSLSEQTMLSVDALARSGQLRFRAAFVAEPAPESEDKKYKYRIWLPGLLRQDFYRYPEVPSTSLRPGVLAMDCVLDQIPALFPKQDPDSAADSVCCGFALQLTRRYPDQPGGTASPMRQLQWLRMGALDIGFAPPLEDLPANYFDQHLDVGGVPTKNRGFPDEAVASRQRSLVMLGWRDARGNWSPDVPTAVVEMQLRVDRALPGGQDGLPDEPFDPIDVVEPVSRGPWDPSPTAVSRRFVRETALVIPATDKTLPTTQFLMRLRESTARSQSQRVALQLFQWKSGVTPAASEKLPLVIIDRQPFLVAMVLAPQLLGIGGVDGNLEVGNWSAEGFEGASWELGGATEGFQMAFPPQAVGESMEKHDGVDAVEGKPAQFRLGPLTRFELDASFFKQNFVEATWNLRRILGYPGQRAPGAAIHSIDFELLYGLVCSVRADGLRLAELSARLGNVAKSLPPRVSRILGKDVDNREIDYLPLRDQIFAFLNYRWSRQYQAYSSRLGIYQPWVGSLSSTLSLTSGVSYLLRDPTQIMQDPTTGEAPPAPSANRMPKLEGGALWGFEFKAQYDPFVLRPERRLSTAGELNRPAFSALGGWGHQKAVFQNGLTTIYSDTAMGRTFFYSVERRGRIAGYWNYAKHVVIYERTVGTSIQFRPLWKDDGTLDVGSQDHLAGRPVLRKVREYVEILQPRRSYPDLGGGEIARGFVESIQFHSKIIPVDGRWGHDVIDQVKNDNVFELQAIGYVIPLWQTGADPAVYPKPHVSLSVAGASAAGDTLVAEIDDPQKLLFFSIADIDPTSQISKELNTDDWPAIRNVDFPDVAWPTAAPVESLSPNRLERPLADEQVLAGGYEQFSYQIVAAKPVNVVANRTEKAVGAMLRNVTMVRANPLSEASAGTQSQERAQAATARARTAEAGSTFAQIDAILQQNLAAAGTRKQVLDAIGRINTAVTEAADAYQQVFPKESTGQPVAMITPRDFPTLMAKSIERWHKQSSQVITQEFEDRLSKRIAQLTSSSDPAKARSLATSYVRESWDILQLAAPGVDTGMNELLGKLNRVVAIPQEIIHHIEIQLTELQAAFEAMLSFSLPDVVPPQDIVDQLVALVDAALRQIQAVVARFVGQAVGALAKHFDVALATDCRKMAEDVDKQLNDWRTKLVAIFSHGADEILDAFDEVWNQLANLEQVLQTTIKIVKDRLQELQTKVDDISKLAVGAGDALESILNVKKPLDDLVAEIARCDVAKLGEVVSKAVDDYKKQVNKLKSLADVVDTSGLIKQLNTASGLLGTIKAADLGGKIKDTVKNWEQDVNNAFDKALQSGDLGALARDIRNTLGSVRGQFDGIIDGLAQPLAAKFPAGVVQEAGNVLRMVRAFGDSPIVQGMEFTRKQLAYFYDPAKALKGVPIDMSPAVALVNRAGNQLKAMGVSLPSGKLLDQVLPAADDFMRQIDLGKMLPDFAGMNLSNLLPDLKAPAGLKDKVKITQDFDKQSGRGWVQADIRIPIAGPSTLFDAASLKVSLRQVLFTAVVRIESGLSGSPKRTQHGSLKAHWDLTLGGTALVTFLDTELTFDESGKTHFSLDPTKVELNGVLSMLSDVMKAVSDPSSGFTLRIKEENGLPVGVEAILNIPLPDMTFGVCALSNLRFGAELSLVAIPEFAITLRVHVAEKATPFSLTIFILGGGGWIDVRGRYLPGSARIVTTASLGLAAGAALAISFGPIKGSVFAFFFVEGELNFDSARSGGAQLTIRIGLILGGNVDVCGLVTVTIRLLLELEYTGDTGTLIGHGYLSVRIKVCFFLTISYSAGVEKRFAGSGGQRQSTEAERQKRVADACDSHLERTA